MNRKSIQILRCNNTYDIQASKEVLLDGQPLYHKGNQNLYIGDGVSELKQLKFIGQDRLELSQLESCEEATVIRINITAPDTEITFYESYGRNIYADWGDINCLPQYSNNLLSISYVYKNIGKYTIRIYGINQLGRCNHPEVIEYCKIGRSVNTLKPGCFQDCTNLSYFYIPDTVTVLGNDIFNGCNNLINIHWSDYITNIPTGCLYKTKLKYLTLPLLCETIKGFSIYVCDDLIELHIRENIKTIEPAAIHSCPNLQRIYVDAVIPPDITNKNIITGCDKLSQIIVPYYSLNAYKEAWSQYAHLIVANIYYNTDGTLTVSDPIKQTDAVNLNYLQPSLSGGGQIAPRIWYKHDVIIEMLFNSEILGVQSIVVRGTYLSKDSVVFNASIDTTNILTYNTYPTNGFMYYNINNGELFNAQYPNIQNAFVNIHGNGFTLNYAYVGSYDASSGINLIGGNITEYYIGGTNGTTAESQATSFSMFFRNNGWFSQEKINTYDLQGNVNGFTYIQKPAYVSTNLFTQFHQGIITRISDNIRRYNA